MICAIVGFGCAGYQAAKALRETAPECEIHVYEAADAPPANPMLMTYYAGGSIGREGVFPFGSLADIAARLKLTVFSGVRVRRVDAGARALVLEDGSVRPYDKILLATGARAVLPRVEGLPDGRVFLMRTVGDADALRRYLAEHTVKTAAVIGASQTGVKVAELLHDAGAEVTLADLADALLPLAARRTVAAELQRRMENQGYRFRWGVAASAVTPAGVRFGDGSELPADVICFCVGTRTNVEAVSAGAEDQPLIRIGRGIVVNEAMETTAPGIYAAGDCCEGTNLMTGETMVIGLWANAASQGETAGINMGGGEARYRGSVPHNIAHFAGLDVMGVGDSRAEGELVTCGTPEGGLYAEAVLDGDRLRCLNVLGGCEAGGILKHYFVKRLEDSSAELAPAQRARLAAAGFTRAFIAAVEGRNRL